MAQELAQFIRSDYPYTMDEQVTDISEELQVMADGIRNMRTTIESQYSEICQLNRKIDKLNAELHKRNKKIEELEEKLAKYESPNKNSG